MHVDQELPRWDIAEPCLISQPYSQVRISNRGRRDAGGSRACCAFPFVQNGCSALRRCTWPAREGGRARWWSGQLPGIRRRTVGDIPLARLAPRPRVLLLGGWRCQPGDSSRRRPDLKQLGFADQPQSNVMFAILCSWSFKSFWFTPEGDRNSRKRKTRRWPMGKRWWER